MSYERIGPPKSPPFTEAFAESEAGIATRIYLQTIGEQAERIAALEAKLTRRDAAFAALVECVRATDQFNESINSCLSCRANLAINQTLCNFHGGRQHWVTEQRCEALKLAEGVEAAT